MSFQPDPQSITWRLHLRAPVATVYAMLSQAQGRTRFWAESAEEQAGVIHFVFPNGATWEGQILAAEPPRRFAVRYYGGSRATFSLEPSPEGGCELTLTDQGVPPAERCEVTAGWVSVLLALKAAVDFGVDLRNHDPAHNWDQGYAEN